MLLTPQPASSRPRPATNMGMRAARHTLDLVLMIGLRYPFIAARRPPATADCRRMNECPRQICRTFEPSHLRHQNLRHHTCVQALASAMATHYSEGGANNPLAGE